LRRSLEKIIGAFRISKDNKLKAEAQEAWQENLLKNKISLSGRCSSQNGIMAE
jgi:hypothetical protein